MAPSASPGWKARRFRAQPLAQSLRSGKRLHGGGNKYVPARTRALAPPKKLCRSWTVSDVMSRDRIAWAANKQRTGSSKGDFFMTQAVRTDTLSSGATTVTLPSAPPASVDDVARRADVYPSRNRPPGTDLDDCHQAEQEFRGASRERARSSNARLLLLTPEDSCMVRTARANVLLKGIDSVTDGIL